MKKSINLMRKSKKSLIRCGNRFRIPSAVTTAFNKNWKSIFEREETARRVSGQIDGIVKKANVQPLPAALTSIKQYWLHKTSSTRI